MILELDCGNSFIKWRVLEVDGAPASAEGVVSSDAALIDGLIALPGLLLTRCRFVSVRAQEETEQLVEALQQLCRLTDSREAAILSTCNRSELYIEQEHLSADGGRQSTTRRRLQTTELSV